MKRDVLIIRIGFIFFLALMGFLLNPLAENSYLGGLNIESRRIISSLFGAIAAIVIVGFEMRVRQATLKTLIGAAIGSTLGIIGAYLIGMLISSQDINTVPGEMKVFMTIALAF